MHILGIDPGTHRIGYGIIDAHDREFTCVSYGILDVTGHNLASRLEKIYDEMCSLLKEARPLRVGIEKLFFQKNQKTALSVAEARGVIVLACAQNNIPIIEMTPLEVKSAITSHGKATKKDVQKMVKLLLHLEQEPQPDDAADALAIAMYTANTYPRL